MLNKLAVPLVFLAILGGGFFMLLKSETPAAPDTQPVAEMSTPRPTRTEAPLVPTIGYAATNGALEGTQAVLQAELDASRRLMVDVTMQAAQITAEAERIQARYVELTAQSGLLTAAAYPTSVPLTATAQIRNWTEAEAQRQVTSGELTGVKEWPTQVVRNAQANAVAKYADTREAVTVGVICAAGVFFLIFGGGIVWLAATDKRRVEFVVSEERPDIEPTFVRDTRGGYVWRRGEVPCTEAQLYEFVDGLLNQGKTLAFDNWRGADSLWKQVGGYDRMRNFLQLHSLAVSTGKSGQLALSIPAGEKWVQDCWAARDDEKRICPPPPGFYCANSGEEAPYARKDYAENGGGGVVE